LLKARWAAATFSGLPDHDFEHDPVVIEFLENGLQHEIRHGGATVESCASNRFCRRAASLIVF
jgi:hypothetical protein